MEQAAKDPGVHAIPYHAVAAHGRAVNDDGFPPVQPVNIHALAGSEPSPPCVAAYKLGINRNIKRLDVNKVMNQ
jgi:hypothetical protein